jgi:hypothetical protein
MDMVTATAVTVAATAGGMAAAMADDGHKWLKANPPCDDAKPVYSEDFMILNIRLSALCSWPPEGVVRLT